jgi:ABC-type branched-subunit amino acid transport system substrate-binding protein
MSRRTCGAHGLAAILLASSMACTGPGLAPTRVPDEQRAAYDAAVARLTAGPAESGAQALEGFIAAYPASPMADDAAMKLAELAFQEGRQEEGVRWLGSILTQHPGSDREPAARLRLAELEYGRDRRVAARGLLDPVDLRRLSPEDARAALQLRVSLSQTPIERMKHLAHLRSVLREETKSARGDGRPAASLAAERRTVDQEIERLVSSAASAELEAMLEDLDHRSPAGEVALELARRSISAGSADDAARAIERAERLAENDEQKALARSLTSELASRPADGAVAAPAELVPLRELSEYTRRDTRGAEGTLGVVLPLSGDFAEFGEASLRGILLAAGVFETREEGASAALSDGLVVESDRDDRPNVRLVVRDSAGDPARAAAAVRELAASEDVVAILGPVFSEEVMASAEAAEAEGIPLVTLSNREDVTQGRKFVLRTRTTPADEVDVLVNHAFDQLSARRFGVLYPRTRYGRGMRKLYWDAIVARGGKLVAMASYAPEETDFSNVIKEMVGFRFLSAGERQAIAARDRAVDAARSLPPAQAAAARRAAFETVGPGGDPLPPIVDFDVLFIPDSAEAVAMIAPGLALQGVRGARLLGSSDWLDSDLLRGADRHVAGAVVSTPFFAASDVGVVRDFVDEYQRTFEGAPDVYAAQGFDAAGLVLQQLAARRRDRASMLEGLLATRAFPGASGSLTMLPDGNARRRPFLVEVSGQRFVPLD